MKVARTALISLAAVCAVVLVGLTVALSSRFQTWTVQRQIRRHPEWHLALAKVDAGFGGVVLSDVTMERNGFRFAAPRVEAQLPLFPALFLKRVHLVRLTARDCRVAALAAPATATHEMDAAPGVRGPGAAAVSATSFAGILPLLELPFDLSVERLDLAGTMAVDGRSMVGTVQGGGLTPGKDGKLDVALDATLGGEKVKSVHVSGTVTIAMDTPRTFARIAGTLAATASGPSLTHPVTLQADVRVARSAQSETYEMILAGADRRLADIAAEYPLKTNRIEGRWKVDLIDRDFAPFLFGRPIPDFTIAGQGKFDTDSTFNAVHAIGELDAALDRLGTVKPELAAIGAVKLVANIDVAQQGDVIAVTKCDVTAGADRPVATVHAIQAFDFNPKTGELRATDADHEVFGVKLEGVPLAWAKPFLRDFAVTGGDLRGELVASPRAGGFNFRSKSPLTSVGVAVARAGRPWIEKVDVSLSASGDYTPQGWQAEVTGFTAKTGAATVLLVDARAGKLAGAEQPIKATGLVTADIATLVAQPLIHGAIPLSGGDATVDFVASLGVTNQLQANVTLKRLASGERSPAEQLPTVTANLRADVAADGKVTLNIPVSLKRDQRESDVRFVGTFARAHPEAPFEAQVTSNTLVIDDAKALAAVLAPTSPSSRPGTAAAPRPFWATLNGAVALQLKKVLYSGTFQLTNVTGTLHFGGGKMSFDQFRAAAGEGDVKLSGALLFQPARAQPFRFGADVALTDFDPGPLFRAINPQQPPTVEGKFVVTSKVTSEAAILEALSRDASGTCELTSKGGIFRGLPVNVGNLVENSGKLAGWLASAGNAITSLAGRKDVEDITSRSQAANELAKMLAAISYDQLAVVLSRDEKFNTTVKEFTLISPEFRLTGSGRATPNPGKPLLADNVNFEFRLRARGRSAELLKYLGVLEPKPDDLGYFGCTIPIKVGGTLAKLDATELSNRLVALAVEKTGFADKLTDKAVDLINRLRGKSPN